MIHKAIGWLLIIDGALSLALPEDKHLLWQVGRTIRILCGITLIIT